MATLSPPPFHPTPPDIVLDPEASSIGVTQIITFGDRVLVITVHFDADPPTCGLIIGCTDTDAPQIQSLQIAKK